MRSLAFCVWGWRATVWDCSSPKPGVWLCLWVILISVEIKYDPWVFAKLLFYFPLLIYYSFINGLHFRLLRMPIICNILFTIIFVNYLVGGLFALRALQLARMLSCSCCQRQHCLHPQLSCNSCLKWSAPLWVLYDVLKKYIRWLKHKEVA